MPLKTKSSYPKRPSQSVASSHDFMVQTTSTIPSDSYASQRTTNDRFTSSRHHDRTPTNGVTSGWSSLRLGASTSRHRVGTRERTRHTYLLGCYVICFTCTSHHPRKPAFLQTIALLFYPNLPYQSYMRVFYTSHLALMRHSRADVLCVNIF